MIAYLKGTIIIKKEKFIVLDVKGIGYKVFLSKKTLSKLPEIGKDLKVFCYLNVSENSLALYGFLDQKELERFEILDKIRGVGPKVALEIASLGPLDKIDEKLIEKIPGIGRKKAMAIILELSGKIKPASASLASGAPADADEAEQGLVSLGFSRQQAKTVLSKVSKDIKDPEQKIKEALKILGR